MSRASRAVIVTICLLAGLLATASPALAATISVDVGAADGIDADGDCSLREAVTAANDDVAGADCTAGTAGLDTITIPSGDATVDAGIAITDDLVIQGTGPLLAAIDLSINPDYGFSIDPLVTVTFEGLTIRNAPAASAIHNEGDLTVDTVAMTNNDALFYGGAVYHLFGTLTIRNSSFEGNSAVDLGGALYLEGGTVTIEDSTFSANNSTGSDGGAIYATGPDLTISGTDFTNNTAAFEGGGLYADCSCVGGSLLIEDSTFDFNSAAAGGAATVVGAGTITGTTFSLNTATDIGGAIFASSGFFEILSIEASFFTNNEADTGGAIFSGSSSVEVIDSTLTLNAATEGAGIFATQSFVTVEGSTLSQNVAVDFGGGIGVVDALLEVVNSTISGNSATGGLDPAGGGVASSDAFTYLLHSTIAGNSSDSGGGVFSEFAGDVTAEGSIISGNTSGVGGECNIPLEDDAANLDSDGTCISAVGSITADPLLGPLANNGGPTATHALPAGSPALNIGDPGPCSSLGGIDQRGEPRPSGGACDLGAFELQFPAPPPQERALSVSRIGEGTVSSEALGIDCGSRCSAMVEHGTTGVLVATPDDGFVFDGWEGDCASIDENECTVELNGDRDVTARFVGVIQKGACKGMTFGSSEVRGVTELVAGTPGDDVLSGNGRNNLICGLGGNDTIKGKGLGDTLLGGSGDDRLVGGKGDDLLKGGPGTDECVGGKGEDTLIACE